MKISDIHLIQHQTGITLPDFYVELVTAYPLELSHSEAVDFGLMSDASAVIRENLCVRAEGYFGEPWPNQYFIIGHNGCGDYFVIKHATRDFSVGFADHELMECRPYASSRVEFIQLLLADIRSQQAT